MGTSPHRVLSYSGHLHFPLLTGLDKVPAARHSLAPRDAGHGDADSVLALTGRGTQDDPGSPAAHARCQRAAERPTRHVGLGNDQMTVGLRRGDGVLQLLIARGEGELSDALDAIDASWWDATLGGVLDQLVGIVVPPLGDRHAVLKTIEWGQGLRSTAADTTRAAFLFRHHASYRKPPKFNSLSRWEKLTAPGDLANWKPAGMRPGGGGAPKPPGVLRNLEKGGKIAGGAMAVLDGALTAYDSYQSDSYNHPEMGEGEKITRAGVKGVTTGALGWAGATYGAQLGATIGAFGGPLGVLAGGIIGGVVGGMAGSWAGSTLSDIANSGISHLFHWGASS